MASPCCSLSGRDERRFTSENDGREHSLLAGTVNMPRPTDGQTASLARECRANLPNALQTSGRALKCKKNKHGGAIKKKEKEKHKFVCSSDPSLQSLHRVVNWQQVDQERYIGTKASVTLLLSPVGQLCVHTAHVLYHD